MVPIPLKPLVKPPVKIILLPVIAGLCVHSSKIDPLLETLRADNLSDGKVTVASAELMSAALLFTFISTVNV